MFHVVRSDLGSSERILDVPGQVRLLLASENGVRLEGEAVLLPPDSVAVPRSD